MDFSPLLTAKEVEELKEERDVILHDIVIKVCSSSLVLFLPSLSLDLLVSASSSS